MNWVRPRDEVAIYEKIGKRIADVREQVTPRLSQARLANRVSLSRTSIVNIECGRHRIQIHVLYDIARVLEVDPRDLLPSIDAVEPRIPRGLERDLGAIEPEGRAQVARLVTPLSKTRRG